MLDDYGFEEFEQSEFPLAYLITIRTFGTWLHGDERTSVNRHGKNIYGSDRRPENSKLIEKMTDKFDQPVIVFNHEERLVVESAIRAVCERRKFYLYAVNVRTNHAHAVVSAQLKPERIADALKAEATKVLREKHLFSRDLQIWARGRSRPYLWKPKDVEAAIAYTLYGQDDGPFIFP